MLSLTIIEFRKYERGFLKSGALVFLAKIKKILLYHKVSAVIDE